MSKSLMIAPLALLLAAAAPPPAAPASDPSLAEVIAATARYKDVKVAEAEGYVREPTNTCETADMMGRPISDGAMGVHYLRPDLLGITAPPNPRIDGNGIHTDFLKPGVLIYEPQADGSMELVAVENLVFLKSWHEAGHTKPPSFQGVPFDRMVDDPATALDEAHMFEGHYDRHVWLYRQNPKGLFTPFNPAVTCAHHKGGAHHHHAAAEPANK